MGNYYYWCITPSGKWLMATSTKDNYGYAPDGKGDLALRMAFYALVTGDVDVIKACIKLLNERKRWPDGLNHENDARNIIDQYWSILLHKIFKTRTVKYRPQRSITRDPYLMLSCAIFWHQYEMIRDLKIPWRIMRPDLYHWKKYLETRDNIHKLKYESWERFNIDIAFKFPGYAKSLCAWQAFIARSDKVKSRLIREIPCWNLLNRLLCGDIIPQEDVKRYISTTGWLWNAETPPDNPTELKEGEPIFLDKRILEFVFDNRKW